MKHQRLLDRHNSRRTKRPNTPRQLPRKIHHLLPFLKHSPNHPNFLPCHSPKIPASINQLGQQGSIRTIICQSIQRAQIGYHSYSNFLDSENGGGICEDHVAGADHVDGAADAVAADAGDDGDSCFGDGVEGVLHLGDEVLDLEASAGWVFCVVVYGVEYVCGCFVYCGLVIVVFNFIICFS